MNRGAEITATNFEYGNIQINNGDVKYGVRIDTRDVHTESKSSSFGISAGINSPILDRAKQAGNAVKQVKDGDTAGGAMEAINATAGTIKGLADNQGTRQTNYDANGSVGKKGAKNASANNNFYANIGVNAGISKSKSTSNSHTESAVLTTMKPADENSSITYNNVNNITHQGTQAQGGTFIYNNVANIQKEAVELHNSYTSSNSSRGINAGATIGYGHKLQTTGNGGSISASQSNQNTVETVYANGNFKNVNEVHNNTGSMVLNGFNQEGGKVTGNIGKLVVESRQNTSTTTGSSSGMSLGISANGVPSSVNISRSRTNGDRAFVDNQSTFIVGDGSNLHVGTLENTGAVVGKQGNSTFKIDNYVGKDIQNHDTMKTTGESLGISTEKPRITNVGFNQDSRDKQGITRNTVVGDVEIAGAEGSPINRDLGKANEVTKDTHSSTNINVESQTIEYATNPSKLKEDIGKAKKEISDVTTAINESINDRGDDNRNFFGQLREVRLNETVNNIAGKRLNEADKSEDVVSAWKDAYKDLGYNLDVKYTTGEDTPEMKDKAGTAYVSKDGVHTIIININAEENSTKAGLIGTLAEEASHIVNGVAGRQIATGTEEKGLESTGRAANAYFKEEYKGSNQNMTYRSDGKIDTSKLGTNVGDACITIINGCMKEKGHISRAALGNPGFMNFINKVSQAVPKVVSFAVDFSPAGTLKGGIEAVTGKDMLTGEEVNLLSRVLGALPFVKSAYRGAKTTIKIIKSSKKAEVVLSDGSKIALKSDEVTKFESKAKRSSKNASTPRTIDPGKIHSTIQQTDKTIKYRALNETIKGQRVFRNSKGFVFYADDFHDPVHYEVFKNKKHVGIINADVLQKNKGDFDIKSVNTSKAEKGRTINIK